MKSNEIIHCPRCDYSGHQQTKVYCKETDKRWKGGVADYPNHGVMRRNRLIKLQQAKGRCEIPDCGKKAYKIHHIDGSKDNHSLDNLIVLCQNHHSMIDSHPAKTSKFIRLYGATAANLAVKLNLSKNTCYELHKIGRLSDIIEDPSVYGKLEKKSLNRNYKKIGSQFSRKYGITAQQMALKLGIGEKTVRNWDKKGKLTNHG